MEKEQVVKHKRNRRLRIAVGILVLFLVWAGMIWWQQQGELADKQARLRELVEEKQKLTDEHQRLQKEKEKLQDPEYIGELARKYYYLSKPGEMIFIPSNSR